MSRDRSYDVECIRGFDVEWKHKRDGEVRAWEFPSRVLISAMVKETPGRSFKFVTDLGESDIKEFWKRQEKELELERQLQVVRREKEEWTKRTIHKMLEDADEDEFALPR